MNESSARIVTKLITDQFDLKSIIDFGCAQGGWLNAWRENGVTDIQGVDGDYVDQGALLIDKSKFLAADLSQSIDLGRTYDIAQCIEVAEHLPASSAKTLVKSLARHAPIVLFSAAPPGQGGRGHVNEQPYEYWRNLFADEGYDLYDWVRPEVSGRHDVQPWYRYNLFLFAHSKVDLPEAIRSAGIPPQGRVMDISPPMYQIRKMLVKCIPGRLQDRISNILARWNG